MARPLIPDDDPQQFAELLDRIRRLEQRVPEEPHRVGTAGEPAFTNSWVNFDSTDRPVQFYKHDGRVYIEGIIASGTLGQAAFTLPSGYLPRVTNNKQLSFTVEGGVNGSLAVIRITGNGAVIPNTSPNNSFIFLYGIDFRSN